MPPFTEKESSMTASGRSYWRVVPLLMGLTFMGHFNRVAISVAGTERIMGQYHITPTQMGVVYSAFLLMYTVFMTPAGAFADRFGPWLALGLMAFGLAAGAVGTGVVGLTVGAAGIVTALLIVRSVMGALSSPLHPSTARTISNWIPSERRGLANGITLGAALVGVASSYYLVGALMDRFGWPVAFIVIGAVTALVGALWLMLAGDTPSARHAAPPIASSDGGWLSLLRKRDLWLVTLGYTALDYFEYLFFYWMQYYFDSVLNVGTDTSRLYATIIALAMAAGMISGGWVTDRLVQRLGLRAGRAAVPVVGMIGGAVFLVVGVMAKDPMWVMIWFSVGVFAATSAEAASWMTAVELGGARGTTAAAMLNTGGNIGGVIAPILTPFVGTTLGWPWAVALGAAISLSGAIFWLFVKPAPPAPQAQLAAA